MNRKLQELRKKMEEYQLDAYIIPGTDPHFSEYIPEYWKRREYISGFTGSAGDLVVLKETAGLWTDSRYFIQAEFQLKDSGISLFKVGLPETPSIPDYLLNTLSPASKVGIDPLLISHTEFVSLQQQLSRKNIELVFPEHNLVDLIWEGRPPFPDHPVFILPVKFSGLPMEEKMDKVKNILKEKNADFLILSKLDAIAWLLNLRGSDIAYNPVFISYLIIGKTQSYLFIHPSKISEEVQHYLSPDVDIRPYDQLSSFLQSLSEGTVVIMDPGQSSEKLFRLLKNRCQILTITDPIEHLKGIKNPTEIKGFREAHVRDGVAMVKFFMWLEKALPEGKVTELTIEKMLESFRAEHSYYQGPSFRTIAAFKEHGAIVHYSCPTDKDTPIEGTGILLIDSGAQYLDGTTDITRTVAIGQPSAEQRKMFTLVLKGLLKLSYTPFPVGTVGKQLDTIARLFLWEHYANYGHGTGHGIGHFLNVHEGPHAISYYRCKGVALEPGMVTSIEPGYYKEGEYGIRIENLALVVEDKPGFLRFESLTLCPIDTTLIDPDLLDNKEKSQLDAYHRLVFQQLSPYLDSQEQQWLEKKTRPIGKS